MESAIVDTCVLLTDPDFIIRAVKVGFPVVTDVVIQEIDSNKRNKDQQVAWNAREIIRQFKKQRCNALNALPCSKALLGGDTLNQFSFGSAPLFVLSRAHYRDRSSNDAKIREIAKDYGLILVTVDGGNKVLAELAGIRAVIWSKPKAPGSPKVKPFKLVSALAKSRDLAKMPGQIPFQGDAVKIGRDDSLETLGREIGGGGEGRVFEVARKGLVAKIYHRDRLTDDRVAKLKRMTSRKVVHKGMCWPKEVVYTRDGCAVGYVMNRAHGTSLQRSVFVKSLLMRKFPNWRRENLVNICLTFLDQMKHLHSLNVLAGDINPSNVLVDNDGSTVFIVDTDSFQIEGYPCPVGTINFTPPALQGKNFKELLRRPNDELFAIATMLFMILVPGKPPYSQQGGVSPAKNIVESNFPYPFGSEKSSQNVPSGPWRFVWSHLPYKVKEAFTKTFSEGDMVSIEDWLKLMQYYKNDVSRGWFSNEIFPIGYKVPKGYGKALECSRTSCGRGFEMHVEAAQKLEKWGQLPICPECRYMDEINSLKSSP